MKLEFWGHRGSQSDNAVSRGYNRPDQPPENTLAAFRHALDHGASGIELDVMPCADARALPFAGDGLVVTHSNDSRFHRFDASGIPLDRQREVAPEDYLSHLTLSEIKKLRVGPRQDGVIPTLREVLIFLKKYEAETGRTITLNIEMKGAKGTAFPSPEKASCTRLLSEALAQSDLPPSQILLSSFDLDELKAMQRRTHGAGLAMLFHGRPGEAEPLHPGRPELGCYAPFTSVAIEHARRELPSLRAVHPEFHDIDAATLQTAARLGLEVNPWFLNETRPDKTALATKLGLAQGAGIVRMHVITNFAGEMRRMLQPAPERTRG